MTRISYTHKTMQLLREQGYLCGVVERYNSFSRKRYDLFGFIDLIAVNNYKTIGVQSTSGTNHASHKRKIITDGIYSRFRLEFGSGFMHSLQNSYSNAIENEGIITSL